MRRKLLAGTALAGLVAAPVQAAVTVEDLTQVKFSGSAKVVNVFAGKAAKKGLAGKTAIDGDRRATMTSNDIEVIDLAAEKIWNYEVNRRGKPGRCRTTTFDERREAMGALEDLDFSGGQANADGSDGEPTGPEYEVTASVTETGAEETHAGMTGKVVDIVITVHQKDMTLEEGGGGRINTTLVVGPKPAGWDETMEWNRRYLEAMGIDGEQFAGLAKVLTASPVLGQAMEEFRSKQDALDGAILRSEMRLYTMANPNAAAEAESEDGGGVPTSLGGLGARLGGSLLKRRREDAAAKGPSEVFMSANKITAYSDTRDDLLTLPDRCKP